METMYKCYFCKEEKPRDQFSKNKSKKLGINRECKSCRKIYDANRKPEIILLKSAKSRARQKKLEFNLTLDDVTIPEFCPVLGIKLERSANVAGDNSPSLDRIDNSKGYIKGNVAVISWRANTLKSSGTEEEIKKVLRYMERSKKSEKFPGIRLWVMLFKKYFLFS